MAYSEIRKRLRDGETVEFEGIKLRMISGKETGATLEPGDTYIAERNRGPQLLTVNYIVDRDYAQRFGLKHSGWVVPTGISYSFDFHECVGVEILIEEEV